MSLAVAAFNRDKKAYIYVMNKKYGTNVSVSQVDQWRMLLKIGAMSLVQMWLGRTFW